MDDISSNRADPLPGGYTAGEKVFYTGTSHTFPSGDKLVHGQQGEVTGPSTLETHKGKGVVVRFPGNTASIGCFLTSVHRLSRVRSPPSRAVRHTRDAACVRPARPSLPRPDPNCKPVRRR